MGSGSMHNSEAGMFERKVGVDPISAHLCAARLVSEAEAHVVRAEEIVSRQRECGANVGELLAPRAVALLKTFEGLLAVSEDSLAAYQRRAARAEQAVHSSKAPSAAPIQDCPEPADPVAPTLDHQDQTCDIDHIMEILREAGYHCESLHENLH